MMGYIVVSCMLEEKARTGITGCSAEGLGTPWSRTDSLGVVAAQDYGNL